MNHPRHRLILRLNLTAPLHTAQVGDAHVDLATRQIRGGSVPPAGGAIPCVRTLHYPLPVPPSTIDATTGYEPAADIPEGESARVPTLPVFSANGLRGRLRRLARALVVKHLLERGEQFSSLAPYHALSCGAVSGRPGATRSFEDAVRDLSHPVLGLFGGGPRLTQSALRVATLWPVCDLSCAIAGLLPAGYDWHAHALPTRGGWGLTHPVTVVRRDDVAELALGTIEEAQAVVANFAAQANEHIAAIAPPAASPADAAPAPGADPATPGAKKARAPKVKRPRSTAQLRTFAGLEVVNTGVVMAGELSLRASDQLNDLAKLGLLLHCVRGLCEHAHLGGMNRLGMGRFSAEVVLAAADGSIAPALVRASGTPPELDLSNPLVERASAAWAQAIEGISASSLEALFAPAAAEEDAE